MPYDQNGKYYRQPIYRVKKFKKGLPLIQDLQPKTRGIIYTSIAMSVLVVAILWVPIQNFIENRDSNSYSYFYQEYIEN